MPPGCRWLHIGRGRAPPSPRPRARTTLRSTVDVSRCRWIARTRSGRSSTSPSRSFRTAIVRLRRRMRSSLPTAGPVSRPPPTAPSSPSTCLGRSPTSATSCSSTPAAPGVREPSTARRSKREGSQRLNTGRTSPRAAGNSDHPPIATARAISQWTPRRSAKPWPSRRSTTGRNPMGRYSSRRMPSGIRTTCGRSSRTRASPSPIPGIATGGDSVSPPSSGRRSRWPASEHPPARPRSLIRVASSRGSRTAWAGIPSWAPVWTRRAIRTTSSWISTG